MANRGGGAVNKKQAIEVFGRAISALYETGREQLGDDLLVARDALDDTHEGFSNRETWEAIHLFWEVYSPDSLKSLSASDIRELGSEYPISIGSLWRVNWDEVAAALKGEGER